METLSALLAFYAGIHGCARNPTLIWHVINNLHYSPFVHRISVQRSSDAELISISRRHHANRIDHDDVIKWKYFPRYWPFVRGVHRSPVNSPHKGKWRGALMFSLICAWINGWVNEAGDLRCHRAHYYVIVMIITYRLSTSLYPVSSLSVAAHVNVDNPGLGEVSRPWAKRDLS